MDQAVRRGHSTVVYLADTYSWLGMDRESKQAAERAKQLDPNAFEILR